MNHVMQVLQLGVDNTKFLSNPRTKGWHNSNNYSGLWGNFLVKEAIRNYETMKTVDAKKCHEYWDARIEVGDDIVEKQY